MSVLYKARSIINAFISNLERTVVDGGEHKRPLGCRSGAYTVSLCLPSTEQKAARASETIEGDEGHASNAGIMVPPVNSEGLQQRVRLIQRCPREMRAPFPPRWESSSERACSASRRELHIQARNVLRRRSMQSSHRVLA